MLEKLIKNFAAYMGMTSSLELDAEGAYLLPLSDLAKIRILQNADNDIVLHAFLGELPASADVNKVYAQMMVGNLFGRETGGAALGLDAEGHIVMVQRIPGESSAEDFSRYMERFINFSEAWVADLGLGEVKES